MISPTDISAAASRVLVQYDVSEAYLFGSFARGEQTPDSDIDLRLICGNTMTFGALYELSHELETELGRKVDIVTNPPEHMRPAFRKSTEPYEVRLYEARQTGLALMSPVARFLGTACITSRLFIFLSKNLVVRRDQRNQKKAYREDLGRRARPTQSK